MPPPSTPQTDGRNLSGKDLNLVMDIDAVSDPSQSFNLQEFLNKFKETVTTGIEFMKKKITDPTEGLEVCVKHLEKKVLERETGVLDMVADLRDLVNDPEDGIVARVERLETDTPFLDSTTATHSHSETDLRRRIHELETRLVVAEQKGQIVLDWADTMYRDHRSLQKQVWFNASKHHANEVIVGGIAEQPQQDYKKAAAAFFKEKLKVESTDGDIKYA